MPPLDDDDELELLKRRRSGERERKAFLSLMLKVGAVALLGVGALLAVRMALNKRDEVRAAKGEKSVQGDTPTPGRATTIQEPDGLEEKTKKMTYSEVLAALRAGEEGTGNIFMSPAGSDQLFVFDSTPNDAAVWAHIWIKDRYPQIPDYCVIFRKHSTAEAARQSAGRVEKGVIPIGVFTVQANKTSLEILDKVRGRMYRALR